MESYSEEIDCDEVDEGCSIGVIQDFVHQKVDLKAK
jgi:hypothetical protein